MKRHEVQLLVGEDRMAAFDWWIIGHAIIVLDGGAVEYQEDDVEEFAAIPKTRW